MMKTNTLFSFSYFLIGGLLTGGDMHPHTGPVAVVAHEATPAKLLTGIGSIRYVAAAAAGRVWEVYVQPGSLIKQGQLLAKLGVPLHTVARQQAETRLRQAQLRYEQLMLATPGQVSAAELAQARQQVFTAAQQLTVLPKPIAFVYVQAPAAGMVAGLPALTGAYLAVADTVVSIRVAAAAPLATAAN